MIYDSIETARREYESFLKSLNTGGAFGSCTAMKDYIKAEIADICAVSEEYKGRYGMLLSDTNAAEHSLLYGVKSVMPRGIYHPSPIINKVIYDFNKEQSIQITIPEDGEYFKYVFDKENQLIRSDFYNDMPVKPYNSEFIIRKGDTEYGLTFHNAWGKINYLCKTAFKNGLVQSTLGFCCDNQGDACSPDMVMDIDSYEEYYYSDGKIVGACVYTINALSCYYSMKEYNFFYLDNGELDGRYTCRYLEDNQLVIREYRMD